MLLAWGAAKSGDTSECVARWRIAQFQIKALLVRRLPTPEKRMNRLADQPPYLLRVKPLLKLQFVYCLIAVLYNLSSIWFVQAHGQALTPTEPVTGIVVMLIYGVFLFPAC